MGALHGLYMIVLIVIIIAIVSILVYGFWTWSQTQIRTQQLEESGRKTLEEAERLLKQMEQGRESS